MWKMTNDPITAPDEPEYFTLEFTKGIPTKLTTFGSTPPTVTGTVTDPVALLVACNAIGRRHGIGRIDIVENRYIGLKSRGCYDTPGLSIIHDAHVDLEGLVLDREVRSLRDSFCTREFTRIIYYGLYFSPEREFVENSIVFSQQSVNGTVRMRAYKGRAYIIGRSSQTEKLYSMEESSMDTLENFSVTE